MIRGGSALVCLLACVVSGTTANALAPEPESRTNPYQGIVERNVFALKPPPPPGPVVPPPKPPPKLTLTGISTFGIKRAFLTTAVPGKPPDFYMLAEGQSVDEISVLEIDEKARTVKVNNHDTVQVLDFINDGAKLTAAPPGPFLSQAVPPNLVPNNNQPRPVVPGVQPQLIPPVQPGQPPQVQAPIRQIPTRTLRLPNPNGENASPTAPSPGAPSPVLPLPR